MQTSATQPTRETQTTVDMSSLTRRDTNTDRREHQRLAGEQAESAESAVAWRTCEKNPDHRNFIPIREFSVQHLPEREQREDVLDWVRVTADLTVRIRVLEVSSKRPQDGHYSLQSPCAGTGFICWGYPTADRCPCGAGECDSTFLFKVATAKHVVYDVTEAKNTIVDLYYDDENSLTDGRVEKLHGVGVVNSYEHVDHCWLLCVTHSWNLAKKLIGQIVRWAELRECIRRENIESSSAIIVSHPHGRPKQVALGEVDCEDPEVPRSLRDLLLFALPTTYTYDTPTCPGSSGAQVIVLNEYWWFRETAFRRMIRVPYDVKAIVHSQRGLEPGLNQGYSLQSFSEAATVLIIVTVLLFLLYLGTCVIDFIGIAVIEFPQYFSLILCIIIALVFCFTVFRWPSGHHCPGQRHQHNV